MSDDGMNWTLHNEFVNEIIDNAPEMWDDDVAAGAIAIDYVRYLEKEVVRLGGALHTSICPSTVHNHHDRTGPDGLHCECWLDGEVCCNCGAPAMLDSERIAQGCEFDHKRLQNF